MSEAGCSLKVPSRPCGSLSLRLFVLVGDTYHNTNRSVLVAAPEITLRPVGARHFGAGGRQ
jgi:hypothetical protein